METILKRSNNQIFLSQNRGWAEIEIKGNP